MTFSWLDYTIFGVYLAASVGVGLLSARGSKSLGDYFLAGRGMNSILVAMSILAAQKAKDPNAGYATDFVHITMKSLLPELKAKGIKVVANAGGVNPRGCAEAVAALARERRRCSATVRAPSRNAASAGPRNSVGVITHTDPSSSRPTRAATTIRPTERDAGSGGTNSGSSEAFRCAKTPRRSNDSRTSSGARRARMVCTRASSASSPSCE